MSFEDVSAIFMYVPCILYMGFISTNNAQYIFFILTIFIL